MNNNLLFFTNKLQNPQVYRELGLPLEFISFGIAEGKMYRHFRNKGAFVVPPNVRGYWGNSVVYGGLFYCPDMWFYLRILDAYMVCSKSSLGQNHINDMHHRIEKDITPIRFNTLDELARLKYREGVQPFEAQFYEGNQHHPKIKSRIRNFVSHRMVDGIEVEHFKSLFREVNEWTNSEKI